MVFVSRASAPYASRTAKHGAFTLQIGWYARRTLKRTHEKLPTQPASYVDRIARTLLPESARDDGRTFLGGNLEDHARRFLCHQTAQNSVSVKLEMANEVALARREETFLALILQQVPEMASFDVVQYRAIHTDKCLTVVRPTVDCKGHGENFGIVEITDEGPVPAYAGDR
jgi:hypothetical protein